MSFVKEASGAIKNVLVSCTGWREFDIAKHAIIEFSMAFGLTDDELIEALTAARGVSAVCDVVISELVEVINETPTN